MFWQLDNTTFTCVALTAVCALFYYLYRTLTFWSRQNIPNLVTHLAYSARRVMAFSDQQCIAKHGKIIGFVIRAYYLIPLYYLKIIFNLKYISTYALFTPVLIVADTELAHEILVKKFAYFADRAAVVPPDQPLGMSLVFAEYENWRKSRSIISKTFSPKNLKQMSLVFDTEVQALITKLLPYAKQNKVVPLLEYFQTSVLNTAMKALFGIKIDCGVENDFNPLVKYTKKILSNDLTLVQTLTFFSPLFSRLFNTQLFDKVSTDYLNDTINNIIVERKKHNDIKQNDFIQFLIDAEDDDETNTSKRLSIKEIIDNSLAFIVGAYDSTTATLCHFIFNLIKNPLVYEKLAIEVDQYSNETDTDSIYEVVNKMPYLEACLKETLRHSPAVASVSRKAMKSTRLSNSLLIPQNAWVVVPVYAIQRDPDLFDNPEQFMPERFLPENIHHLKAGSYLAFGDGPHNCVGMRFAYLQIKVFMVRLLLAFQFKCDPNQRTETLEYHTGLPFMQPRKLSVKIVER